MRSRILLKLKENALQNPQKIAVALGENKYTFKELYEESIRLSSAIDSRYIKRPVVVFANREVETLLFFFAVIASGNFYVPLDPAMPIDKMKAIVNEIEPVCFFGNEKNRELATELDGQLELLTIQAAGSYQHETEVLEDFPLYMIYTSGSTGKPKGVLKNHKAMISFMETFVTTFGITDEIIGNQTPFYFDASAKDIYLMIESGSTLEIIPEGYFVIPPKLISYLNERKITFISWVPTVLSLVAQMKAFQYVFPRYLNKVFFVGEVMPVKSLNYWVKSLPGVRFTNLYGQSEIAGVACYYTVESVYDEDKFLPIGKPLSNCKVCLMDNGKILTKPNAVGEIVIISEALAVGYYKDETNPAFEIMNGERTFHTGDYAFYEEAGNLVFVARRDSQIKHLGRRIELGEIEAIAGSINGVERCCCLYDGMKSRIVLFCQTQVDGEIIKENLKARLSEYMVPEKVVIMEEIPINANGKLDRQRLKEML